MSKILVIGVGSAGRKTVKHMKDTGIRTIDVCFDADRLDFGRGGIVLMATEQGTYYAAILN